MPEQPYDLTTDEEDALVAAELAELDHQRELRLAITDEQLREQGLKEYRPGYFFHDPRYPEFTPEDRYLMDHPGPPKITTPQRRRMVRPMIGRYKSEHWDEEQLNGESLDDWQPKPTKIEVRTPYEPSGQEVFDPQQHGSRYTALWLCQICRQRLALWPTEKSWMGKVLGLRLTVVFCAPISCTQCRMTEFTTHQKLGHQDYRDFWRKLGRLKVYWTIRIRSRLGRR